MCVCVCVCVCLPACLSACLSVSVCVCGYLFLNVTFEISLYNRTSVTFTGGYDWSCYIYIKLTQMPQECLFCFAGL